MRIFVAKFNFDAERGTVLEGTLFAALSEYGLPISIRRNAYLDWSEESEKYYTELEAIASMPNRETVPPVEDLTLYPPKRKKKNASTNEKTKSKKK